MEAIKNDQTLAELSKQFEVHPVTAYMLGKDIDFSDAAIGNMLAGKTMPSFDFLSKLLDLFPLINANWLIGERGEMFLDPNMKVKPVKVKEPPKDLIEAKNDLISLQTKNIELLETSMKELRNELKTYKKGSLLIRVGSAVPIDL